MKVKPKLKWKLKDVGDARTMGNLPWKALPYTKRETVLQVAELEERGYAALSSPDNSIMSPRCLVCNYRS